MVCDGTSMRDYQGFCVGDSTFGRCAVRTMYQNSFNKDFDSASLKHPITSPHLYATAEVLSSFVDVQRRLRDAFAEVKIEDIMPGPFRILHRWVYARGPGP